MYSERFSLPFLSGVLIAAAERRRPGLGPWTKESEAALKDEWAKSLAEAKTSFFALLDDKPYWDNTERTLTEVCLPRYLAEAKKQTDLEQRDYDLWRGGDLVSRGVYALIAFLVGLFIVKAPFIEFIPTTWDALYFAMAIAAPLIPDGQIAVKNRKHRRRLRRIVEDMREADAQHRLYQPLQLADVSAVDPGAALPAPTDAPNKERAS